MAIFKGAGVAIVTPMYEDGKVNYDKLEELLEYQIANSTDAIIICGTTGESSTMTHGEHLKTIKFAIDKVNKRVPVIAGTGSNCTETAIMMSKEAASYGADALLIVTQPFIILALILLMRIQSSFPLMGRHLGPKDSVIRSVYQFTSVLYSSLS